MCCVLVFYFFFSSRRRHTRLQGDWSSDVCSSDLEWVKGKSVDEALTIKNTHIAKELALPPVKIHCSVLAEDAIKAAIADWKKKKGLAPQAEHKPEEQSVDG